MNFFNKIKFKYTIVKNGLGFSLEILEGIYETYLNHKKIIHFRDGFPVYSMSIPALFSKPSIKLFSRLSFRLVSNRSLPILMSIAVSDICNADCYHCSYFNGMHHEDKKKLDFEELKDLIHQGQELGASVLNFVGGEPLLRKNICEIIKCVDKNLSSTVIFTNGWALKEKANSLRGAGLDGVYVSIDSSDKNIHDKLRNTPGIFEKALSGIEAALKTGMTVGISCCLSKEAYLRGDFDKIVELGKKLKIHEIIVFDQIPCGKLKNCKNQLKDNSWIDNLITTSKKYNENDKYPGILVYSYTTSYKSTGCAGGKNYLYIAPHGDVCACDFNSKSYGNVKESPLHKIWEKMSSEKEENYSKWCSCMLRE